MARTQREQTAPWIVEGSAKRESVQRMFDDIAPTYDFCNSLMSLRLHHRWRAEAVRALALEAGDTVIDVCSGTGDFLPPLRKAVGRQGRILAVDFSGQMLARSSAKDPGSLKVLGDACRLPLVAGVANAITVGWGIRNVPDIDAAHREIYRVLKQGGVFVSLDMALPKNKVLRGLSTFVGCRLLPLLGGLLGKRQAYTYLPQSTQTFFTREQLAESMRRAGFVDVTFRDFFFGNICLHRGVKP